MFQYWSFLRELSERRTWKYSNLFLERFCEKLKSFYASYSSDEGLNYFKVFLDRIVLQELLFSYAIYSINDMLKYFKLFHRGYQITANEMYLISANEIL